MACQQGISCALISKPFTALLVNAMKPTESPSIARALSGRLPAPHCLTPLSSIHSGFPKLKAFYLRASDTSDSELAAHARPDDSP